MNVAAWLQKCGRSHADRPALSIGRSVHLDFAGWAKRAATIARHLREDFGCVPGDRVALAMRNSVEYLELKFAIWHAGLIAVPINAKLHRNEFAFALRDPAVYGGRRPCWIVVDRSK